MKKVYFEKGCYKKYQRLVSKNKILKQQIKKCLERLSLDPAHPSLRLHKLVGRKRVAWSASINMSLRLIFQFKEDGIFIIDIGKHEEVY